MNFKIKNRLKNRIKEISCIFFIATFLLVFTLNIFAAGLKKGIHEIVNPQNKSKMYIDENGKILVKSVGNNSNVEIIKDLFTGEPLYFVEYYTKVGEIEENPYSEWSDEWYKWEEENRDMSSFGARLHIYQNAIKPSNKYFDLNGKEVFKEINGRQIKAAFDDYLIFEDGTFYNILFGEEITNIEIEKDVGDKIVSGNVMVSSFYDYIVMYVFSAKSEHYGNIYFYDKNCAFIKKIEQYQTIEEMYEHKTYKWYDIDLKDNNNQKYLLLENRNIDNYAKFDSSYSYNVVDKDLNVLLTEDVDYFEKLNINGNIIYNTNYVDEKENLKEIKRKKIPTSLSEDGTKFIINMSSLGLNDIIWEDITYLKLEGYTINILGEDARVELIEFNGNKYLYVSKDYSEHFICDLYGNRLVNIEGYPSGSDFGAYKIYSINDEKIVFIARDNIVVYDDNFKLLLNFEDDYTTGEIPDEVISSSNVTEIRKIINGEYYLFKFGKNIQLLFDKNFKTMRGTNYKTRSVRYIDDLEGIISKEIGEKYILTYEKTNNKYNKVNLKIYDKNLKLVKYFEQVNNIIDFKIDNKYYYYIVDWNQGINNLDIYNDNFKLVTNKDEKYNNIYNMADNGEEWSEGESEMDRLIELNKYAVIYNDNMLKYVDKEFKTVLQIKINNNLTPKYLSDKYVIIEKYDEGKWQDNSSYTYDLYIVGENKKLTDYKFIGNIKDDHFTFLNGFYYGLMDYDFNILCQYSIFDSFDTD